MMKDERERKRSSSGCDEEDKGSRWGKERMGALFLMFSGLETVEEEERPGGRLPASCALRLFK